MAKDKDLGKILSDAEEYGRQQRLNPVEEEGSGGTGGTDLLEHMIMRGLYRPGLRELVHFDKESQVQVPTNQLMMSCLVRFAMYAGAVVWLMGAVLFIYWAAVPPRRPWMVWVVGLVLLFGLLAGFAAAKPRNLFLGRMDREIREPYGDHPTAELIERMIEMGLMAGQAPGPSSKMRVPVPVQYSGPGTTPVVPVMSGDDPIVEGAALDPDFADLIDFVDRASTRGLARGAWVSPGKPRAKLASGRVITRPVWEELVAALSEWHLVEKTPDNRWEWVVDAKHAREQLLVAAREAVTFDKSAYTPAPAGTFTKQLPAFRTDIDEDEEIY